MRVISFVFLMIITHDVYSGSLGTKAAGNIPAYGMIPNLGLDLHTGEDGNYKIYERFVPYGMSYALFQNTNYDDHALEANFSFRYIFDDSRIGKSKDTVKDWKSFSQFFFSYTGEFDFYYNKDEKPYRESEPVINRLNNFGFHYTRFYPNNKSSLNYGEISVEHRSNGQSDNAETIDAEVKYDNEEYQAFDTLSRGANYVTIKTGHRANKGFTYQAGFKIYLSQSADVTWGPLADKKPDFEDYDRLRLSASYAFSRVTLTGQYTVGDIRSKGDSVDFIVVFPFNRWGFELPIIFKVHEGPMENLSNYTQRTTSYGIGLALKY